MLVDWNAFVLTLCIICIMVAIILILTHADCNFLKESSSSCDYFFEGQLNELLVNKNDLDLSILHLNARSLYGNFEKFKQLLGLLDHEFSVKVYLRPG